MEIIINLRHELEAAADEKMKEFSQHYFKEKIVTYGIKNVTVTQIGRKYLKLTKDLDKKEVFALCEELFKSDYIEEGFIAADWAYSRRKEFQPEDFPVFERWIDLYITNWAECDTLCNHTVGDFVKQYPQFIANLKQWARSKNRWVKRASAVTLILPAREGLFLPDIIEIADILLMDKDDMVQKGYGWMLKEASKKHLEEVFEYIMHNKKVMPRTALRYAIEKMPDELKQRAMERG